MGAITEAIKAQKDASLRGPDCTVRTLAESLPAKDRAELYEWIDGGEYASVISRGLLTIAQQKQEAGEPHHLWEIRANTIQRHRKRGTPDGCKCPVKL